MKVATFSTRFRRRARTLPALDVAPLLTIYRRWHAAPETLENGTLLQIARDIGDGRGDFDDADVWALGQEALGLLDALIERRTGS